MKSIILVAFLFAGGIWAADEAADRVAIENTIRQFSLTPARADLYTADFDGRAELERLGPLSAGSIPITAEGAPGTLIISKEPMGEAIWLPAGSVPVTGLVIKKMRFLTPEVAMVDGTGSRPVLIVLKKSGSDWKIASLRVLAEQ